MATLVLGAVGGAVAGPFGTAMGALAGAAFDNAGLGRRREGPRLADLAVQLSSYGSAVPLVFGTMRVAGTVIWAADLTEHRDRGGKGRATTYSYSGSFAVALSGRPIVRVGRIWADGTLLRGAGGDLKVKATLRVHRGDEDQAADPLIASAESATPAYRGIAYAVFEDLALVDFGNRIPSLTFEVVADEAGAVMEDVAAACGAAAAGAKGSATGYAASGAARDNLAVVAKLTGGWWTAAGAVPALVGDGTLLRTVEDAGARAPGLSGSAATRRLAAAGPGAVAVAYYDPARDYQAGVQHGGAPTAAAARIELPAAMDAGAARALAAALAARATVERGRRTITGGLAALDVGPGEVVAVAGEEGRWRVVETALEAMAVRLTLAPLARAALPARAADPGRAATASDEPAGATLLRLVELPAGDDALPTGPRLGVLAAGEGAGWRHAALWWSGDDGASWTELGETAAPAVIGAVEAVPAAAPATLLDLAGVFTVRLANAAMTLADADDAALARGYNLAAAGGELFQFGRAIPIGDGRWRLERLLRARRGSDAVATAGDGFALIEPAATRVLDVPAAMAGRAVRVMASGIGDARAAEARIVPDGLAMRPPAPVKLRRAADGLRWTRRSRLGWSWNNGTDAPLGEEREAYRLTLTDVGGETRDVETREPWLPLNPDALAALAEAAVRQRGTWAESRPTAMEEEA